VKEIRKDLGRLFEKGKLTPTRGGAAGQAVAEMNIASNHLQF